MKIQTSYWDFIAEELPWYSSDDRVLYCDILFRYLTNEEVADEDIVWIQEQFDDRKAIVEELKRVEKDLFSEAINVYYDNLLNYMTKRQKLEKEISLLNNQLSELDKG